MGNNISHLIIWGNEDEDDNSKNPISALEILEHFWEKEKERWIVIIVWGHIAMWMHTAHLLATTLSHNHVIFAQTNELGNMILSNDILQQRPEPTMENLIQQISDDLEKRMTVMKDDISSYSIIQKEDIAHKKEQEKRRRRHLHKKKVSTSKKG